MKLSILAGTTSKLLDIFIQDSSSTTGAGLAGLTSGSSGLKWYYYREGANAAVNYTASLASMTLGTWTTGGFIAIDNTNMVGFYQIGAPDAALAAGAKSVVMMLYGVTNMAPLVLEIELTAVDNQNAVRYGMTSLPNAAAEAAGGLYTRGSGAGQITQSTNGQVDVDAKKINSVSTSSVTAVNANQGTTQPINFTGTGASALAKADTVDIAGAAVSTSSAQIGTNVIQINSDAVAAAALSKSTNSICYGTCSGGTTTTAVVGTLVNPSSLTASGQLIGRTIIFLGSTATGGVQAQASNITGSTTGSTPTITFTAMTTAPANTDTFVIL